MSRALRVACPSLCQISTQLINFLKRRLTAFVVKTFAQAMKYIFVDRDELFQTVDWIIQQQSPDGSFPSTGRVFNKRLQGTSEGRVSLTAYVLISLMEAGKHIKVNLFYKS